MSADLTPAPAASTCAGCGRPRPEGFVACKLCWDQLPFSLRQEFSKADLGKRRTMLGRILELLRTPPALAAAILLLLWPTCALATAEQEGQLRAELSAAIQAGEEARAAGEIIRQENEALKTANLGLNATLTETTLSLGRAEAEATRLKLDADTNQKAAEENATKLRKAAEEISHLEESRARWRRWAIGLALAAAIYLGLRLHPATRLLVP